MVLHDAPEPREIGEGFQFLAELRDFVPLERYVAPTEKVDLVATSSYGLTFTAYEQKVLVYNTGRLVDEGNADVLCEVPTNGRVTHVSCSCDGLTLFVVVICENNPYGWLYDCREFQQGRQNLVPFYTYPLSTSVGSRVISSAWNPTDPLCLAVVTSEGNLSVVRLKETSVEFNSKSGIKASAICWSAKGKQLAVGLTNGTLVLVKPDLTAVRTVSAPPSPGHDGSTAGRVLSLVWFTNNEFFIAYAVKGESGEFPGLFYVNAPKAAEPDFCYFEDICYSNGEKARPLTYYMTFVAEWNLLFVLSSRGIEMGVVGQVENGQDKKGPGSFLQWCLDEGKGAAMHLVNVTKETYPLGLALDLTSKKRFQLTEDTQYSPFPSLIAPSTGGKFNIFRVDNRFYSGPSLCKDSLDLLAAGGARKAQQFGQAPVIKREQVESPKQTISVGSTNFSLPSSQNVSSASPNLSSSLSFASSAAGTPFSFSKAEKSEPTPTIQSGTSVFSLAAKQGNAGSIFGGPNSQPLSFSTPFAKQTTSEGSFLSGVVSTTKPGPNEKVSSQQGLAVMSGASSLTPSSAAKPHLEQQTSPGVLLFTPKTSPFFGQTSSVIPSSASNGAASSQSLSAAINSLSSSSGALATPTSVVEPRRDPLPTQSAKTRADVKPTQTIKTLPTASRAELIKRIAQETELFTRELQGFCQKNASLRAEVGTQSNVEDLVELTKRCQDWATGSSDKMRDLSDKVMGEHDTILNAYASYEDANASRFSKSSESVVDMLRPLDPFTKRQLKEIRARSNHIVNELAAANDKLAVEWDRHKEGKGGRRSIFAPTTEHLYRSVLNIRNSRITAQKKVDRISHQVKNVKDKVLLLHFQKLSLDNTFLKANQRDLSLLGIPKNSLRSVLSRRTSVPVREQAFFGTPLKRRDIADEKSTAHSPYKETTTPISAQKQTPTTPLAALSSLVGKVPVDADVGNLEKQTPVKHGDSSVLPFGGLINTIGEQKHGVSTASNVHFREKAEQPLLRSVENIGSSGGSELMTRGLEPSKIESFLTSSGKEDRPPNYGSGSIFKPTPTFPPSPASTVSSSLFDKLSPSVTSSGLIFSFGSAFSESAKSKSSSNQTKQQIGVTGTANLGTAALTSSNSLVSPLFKEGFSTTLSSTSSNIFTPIAAPKTDSKPFSFSAGLISTTTTSSSADVAQSSFATKGSGIFSTTSSTSKYTFEPKAPVVGTSSPMFAALSDGGLSSSFSIVSSMSSVGGSTDISSKQSLSSTTTTTSSSFFGLSSTPLIFGGPAPTSTSTASNASLASLFKGPSVAVAKTSSSLTGSSMTAPADPVTFASVVQSSGTAEAVFSPSLFSSAEKNTSNTSGSLFQALGSTTSKVGFPSSFSGSLFSVTSSSAPSLFGGNTGKPGSSSAFSVASSSSSDLSASVAVSQAVDSPVSSLSIPTTPTTSVFNASSASLFTTSVASTFATSTTPQSLASVSILSSPATAAPSFLAQTGPAATTSLFGVPSTTSLLGGAASSLFGETTAVSFEVKSTSSFVPSTSASVFGLSTSTLGQPSSLSAPVQSSTSSLNLPSSTSSLFGSQIGAFSFGSAIKTTSGSLFGQPSATTASSLFGQQSQTTSNFLFGQTTTATTTTVSIFGQPATSTNNLFGQPTSASSSSVFGQPSSASSSSVFGQPTSASSSSVFGQPTSSSSNSVFGQPTSASSSSVFGQLATSASSSSVFGRPTNASSNSVFGQPTNASSSSVFGQLPATSSSPFGQPAITSTLFGQPSSSTAGGVFGQPNSGSVGYTFGQSSASSVSGGSSPFMKASVFGNAPTSMGSSLFGGTPSTTGGTSVFGGVAGASSNTGVFGQSSSDPIFGSGTGGFFSGLGSAVSKENASKNIFGGQPAVGSENQQTNIFGNTVARPFGSKIEGGNFSGGSVFGASASPTCSGQSQNTFGSFSPIKSGGSTFGGGPTFGAAPTFGSQQPIGSTFGTSGGSTFGGSSFGSPSASGGFASLVKTTQEEASFSSLSKNVTSNAPFGSSAGIGTGSSFSSWR